MSNFQNFNDIDGPDSTNIVDGVDPSLKATVTAALAVKVDGSAVVQPVSQSTTPWIVQESLAKPGLDVKYNEISSIASGSETAVISYTATGSGYRINRIMVSGENIALFRVKINGSTIVSKRTFFGNLNEDFNFEEYSNGLKLAATDVISVTVLHGRPFLANFEATILGLNL